MKLKDYELLIPRYWEVKNNPSYIFASDYLSYLTSDDVIVIAPKADIFYLRPYTIEQIVEDVRSYKDVIEAARSVVGGHWKRCVTEHCEHWCWMLGIEDDYLNRCWLL